MITLNEVYPVLVPGWHYGWVLLHLPLLTDVSLLTESARLVLQDGDVDSFASLCIHVISKSKHSFFSLCIFLTSSLSKMDFLKSKLPVMSIAALVFSDSSFE